MLMFMGRLTLLLSLFGNSIYAINPFGSDESNNDILQRERLFSDDKETLPSFKPREEQGFNITKTPSEAPQLATATPLTLYITLSPDSAAFTFTGRSNMSISEVKKQLQQMTGMSLNESDLFYNSIPLENARSVADYGITNGAFLNVVSRTPAITKKFVDVNSFFNTAPAYNSIPLSNPAPVAGPSYNPVVNTDFYTSYNPIPVPNPIPSYNPSTISANSNNGYRPAANTYSNFNPIPVQVPVLAPISLSLSKNKTNSYSNSNNMTSYQERPMKIRILSISGGEMLTIFGLKTMQVLELKNQLQSLLNAPAQDIHLYFKSRQMDDDRALKYYDIYDNSSIQAFIGRETTQTYHIDLSQFGGYTIPVDIDLTNTVHEIKMKIHEQTGYPYETMRLAFGSKQLNNNDLLLQCNIPNGSTLQLLNAISLYDDRNGELFTVYGSRYSQVRDIKEQVQQLLEKQKRHISFNDIYISHMGMRLSDDRNTLEQYGVMPNAPLALCFRSHDHSR